MSHQSINNKYMDPHYFIFVITNIVEVYFNGTTNAKDLFSN